MGNRTILFVALLFIGLLALAFAWQAGVFMEEDVGNDIPIRSQFPGKIVYTTDTGLDPQLFIDDCRSRGGVFNECGSICEPGADLCAEVCAYTCELSEDGNGAAVNDWQIYQDPQMGFSLEYPKYMEVNEQENSVSFVHWGPTQRAGTELYDGISLAIRGYDEEAMGSPQEYIANDIEEAEFLGEVLAEMATTTFSGSQAFEYEIRTLGVFKKIVLPVENNEYDFLEISYSVPDPENAGHQQVVNEILDSFRLW